MNEKLAYRPLLAGIGIVASTHGRWVTLGLFLDGHGQRWGLTALHGLGNLGAQPRVVISQGPWRAAGTTIATVEADRLRIAAGLDAVAFPLDAGIASVDEVAGFGFWQALSRAPLRGETVVKVGARTGLTLGRVAGINGAAVEIERLPHYPAQYTLSDAGDSGAVWFALTDRAPLVLHRQMRVTSSRAVGTAMSAVTAALRLGL